MNLKINIVKFSIYILSGVALVSPLYLSALTKIIMVLATTLIFALSGGVVFGLISLCIALCFVSTLHLLLSLPFGIWGLSQPLLFLCFSAAGLASSILVKRLVKQEHQGVAVDAIALATFSSIALLLFRWRVSGPAHILGVLKAEDNSRWIMAASQLSSYGEGVVHPNSSAGGGYLLDYFISIIRFITVGGNPEVDRDPTTAYFTIINIYYVVLLFSFVIIASYAYFFIKNHVAIHGTLTAPIGVVFLLFPTMSIVFVNYGHLSLLVAILFFWTTCYLLLLETTETTRYWKIPSLACLTALGIMGGWWPAIPITVSILLFTLYRTTYQLIFKRVWLLKFFAPLMLLCLLYFPLKGIRPLTNLRVFYGATGGVIPFTNLNSIMCVLALGYTTYLLANVHTNTARIQPMVFPFICGGVYAIFLTLSSEFVGPNFTAAYSANKALAFFVISTSPMLIIALVAFLVNHLQIKSAVFSLLITYLLSMICFGSHWNFPQSIKEPIWAQTLIDVVRKHPGSPIVCSTSQEEFRGDAYICSRHATSINYRNSIENSDQGRIFEYIWRTMVVTPRSIGDEKGFPIIQEFDLYQKEQNAKVPIVISLDQKFGFMQSDVWWMKRLPWDKFLIVSAETGKQLKNTTNDLIVSAYDPVNTNLIGIATGFIDKIDLDKNIVKISGWADFGTDTPRLMLRNLKDNYPVDSQIFVRPDISNPTVRGFEISYQINSEIKNGYCPVLVVGSKNYALSSTDSKC